jgi:hypothetical protein
MFTNEQMLTDTYFLSFEWVLKRNVKLLVIHSHVHP